MKTMQLFCIYIILIILTTSFAAKEDVDENYCGKLSSCEYEHIHCEVPTKDSFGTSCPADRELFVYKNNKTFTDEIRVTLNSARQTIATGKFGIFPGAHKMLHLTWSNELADLAERAARNCITRLSGCTNTKTLPHVGQVVSFMRLENKTTIDKFQFVRDILEGYLSEYHNYKAGDIDKYEYKKFSTRRHFALMMKDKVSQLGCAGIRYLREDNINIYMLVCACDYDRVEGEPIYVKSKTPGDGCTPPKYRRHTTYTNLCVTQQRNV